MRLLAILSAATLVSGCATIITPSNCERALTGLSAAQDIAAVLQARGIAADVAQKLGTALAVGEVGVGVVCGSGGVV